MYNSASYLDWNLKTISVSTATHHRGKNNVANATIKVR